VNAPPALLNLYVRQADSIGREAKLLRDEIQILI
jgi:hypothetical protein